MSHKLPINYNSNRQSQSLSRNNDNNNNTTTSLYSSIDIRSHSRDNSNKRNRSHSNERKTIRSNSRSNSRLRTDTAKTTTAVSNKDIRSNNNNNINNTNQRNNRNNNNIITTTSTNKQQYKPIIQKTTEITATTTKPISSKQVINKINYTLPSIDNIYKPIELYHYTNTILKSLMIEQYNKDNNNIINNKIHNISENKSIALCSDCNQYYTVTGYNNNTIKYINHNSSNDNNNITITVKSNNINNTTNISINTIKCINKNIFICGCNTGLLYIYNINYNDNNNNIDITLLAHYNTPQIYNNINNSTQSLSCVNNISYNNILDNQHIYIANGNGIISLFNINTYKYDILLNNNINDNICSQYYICQLNKHIICSIGYNNILYIYDIHKQCIIKQVNTIDDVADHNHNIYVLSMAVNSTHDYISISYSNNTVVTYHTKTYLLCNILHCTVQPSYILYDYCNNINNYTERLTICSKYSNIIQYYDINNNKLIAERNVDSNKTINAICSYNDSTTNQYNMTVVTNDNSMHKYKHPFI